MGVPPFEGVVHSAALSGDESCEQFQGIPALRFFATEPQIKNLSKANVVMIQPGIESFHDEVLKLMNKGTSTIQNIQTLKWCMEYEVFPELATYHFQK